MLAVTAVSVGPFVSISLVQTAERLFSVAVELDATYTVRPWLLHRVRVDLLCDTCIGVYQFLHILALDTVGNNAVNVSFSLPYDTVADYSSSNFWVNATAWTVLAPAHDTPLESMASGQVAYVNDETWNPGALYTTYYPDLLAYCNVSNVCYLYPLENNWIGSSFVHVHCSITLLLFYPLNVLIPQNLLGPSLLGPVDSLTPYLASLYHLNSIASSGNDPIVQAIGFTSTCGYTTAGFVDEGGSDFNSVSVSTHQLLLIQPIDNTHIIIVLGLLFPVAAVCRLCAFIRQ